MNKYKDNFSTSARFAATSNNRNKRCPGIVEHLDLQDIASFLRSTSGRFARKERHTANAFPNPQGNLFRSRKITFSHQNAELFR